MKPVKTHLLFLALVALPVAMGCSSDPGPNAPGTQVAGERPNPSGSPGEGRAAAGVQIPGDSHVEAIMTPYPVPNPWRNEGEQVQPTPNPWNGGNSGGGANQDPKDHTRPFYSAEGESLKDPR